jgi:chromosome segregation ATPase
MTINIEQDLGSILNNLNSKLDKIDEKLDTKLDKLESKIEQRFDKVDERLNKLEISQADLKGDIKALDTKTDQLDKRIGNVEFANRGILIGLLVVILGGFAMLFWTVSK